MANGTLPVTAERLGRAGVTVRAAVAELTLSLAVAELRVTVAPA